MKILLTERFANWWQGEPQRPSPAMLDLGDQRLQFYLVISLGNGRYDEACFVTDSVDAYRLVIGLLTGAGRARLLESVETRDGWMLYRAGYEVYLQGRDAYFFVDPQPRPELFAS